MRTRDEIMLRVAAAGLALLALTDASVGAEPTGAAGRRAVVADADGLRFEHHVAYEVDPAASVVHARHEATLTNEQPDRVSGAYVEYTYLPEIGFPVVPEAVNLRAQRADGTSLSVRVEPSGSPVVAFAVVDLSPDLRYRDSQSIVLTYDMPRVEPRSEAILRVNEAFVTFPVLADGDAGLTSLEVRVPDAFDVEVVGDDMEEVADGSTTVLRAEPGDPAVWFTMVMARRDEALLSREVDVGEHGAVVRAWPDDPAWADFAEAQVRDGVPALERLLDLRWPTDRRIDVLETVAPYLYGYAGWYQPLEGVVEVGDELDQHVVLHELSHLWFNDDLFQERWINEAFADLFAAAATAELGGTPSEPSPIDPAAPGALALNAWESPDLEAEISAEQEAFGYNAAWALLDQVADEVGLDAVAAVVRSADAGTSAYTGPGVEHEMSRRFDWTELLDLLEEQAGSRAAADLFGRHVVAPDELPRFEARAASRARYAELLARRPGWAAPAAVRLALGDWRFESADRLMGESGAVLDRVGEVEADLSSIDALAEVGTGGLEDLYEGSRNLDDLAEAVAEVEGAAHDLRDAAAAAGRSPGLLGAVGLLFSSPDAALDRAGDAFEEGRWALASDRAVDVVRTVDSAAVTGAARLAAAGALAVALLLLRRARAVRAAARADHPVAGPEADRSVA